MSLDEAVDLVLFAFQNGVSGDILVQKAPACTIGVLAEAVKELFCPDTDIKVIGIRHGEKCMRLCSPTKNAPTPKIWESSTAYPAISVRSIMINILRRAT